MIRKNLYGALLLATAGVLLVIAGCSNNGTSSGSEMCREEANPDKRDYPGDGGCGNPNNQGPDVDGDDIPNFLDPDIDGDGIGNGDDFDIDGDGLPNITDPVPGGDSGSGSGPGTGAPPCSSAQIIPPRPSDGATGDEVDVHWKLLPEGCALRSPRSALAQAHAKVAAGGRVAPTNSAPTHPGALRARIQIPPTCAGEDALISYDIIEVGLALNDRQAPLKFEYRQSIKHRIRENCQSENPDSGNNGDDGKQCSDFGAIGQEYPNCSCPKPTDDFINDACVPERRPPLGLPRPECSDFGASGDDYPYCDCPDGSDFNPITNRCEGNSGGDGSDNGAGTCLSARIIFPHPDMHVPTGQEVTVHWELSPFGCKMPDPDKTFRVHADATHNRESVPSESADVLPTKGQVQIEVPRTSCHSLLWLKKNGARLPVTYEIFGLADLLDEKHKGHHKTNVAHEVDVSHCSGTE
ncbi:hypothetical protein ACYVVI_02555 [Arenicellales bacterium IMCC57338]